ncbi:MAG: glycine cleavage system aminomethyltransferase GcvT [Candidatus Cloacimonetes bacterium]|nr:glycine cleavage system aminomethyltransferase GcvT [Candidatus Cloacimonadota bacterium]
MLKEPQKTILHSCHEKLKARIIDFHGFMMPVQYSGIIKEHEAVRNDCGVFDVSHMGEFELKGPDAESALQKLLPNDVSELLDFQCLYSPMLRENGTIVDDLLVYRYSKEHYMIVVNASNIDKDFEHMSQRLSGDASLTDLSPKTALIAVQGPKSPEIVSRVLNEELKDLKTYFFRTGQIQSDTLLVSRTGYTGEDGFEIYLPNHCAQIVFEQLIEAGATPCGLGARDTLRFEARLPLYGNELTDETNPLETGLGRFVKMDGHDFVGKDALQKLKEKGIARKLVGLEFSDKAISRTGAIVQNLQSEPVGVVTSGSFCPSLNTSCALALVQAEGIKIGTRLLVETRGKFREAKVVKTPFYKRSLE